MTVVLGRDMDSVVVDSDATAKQCIALLKRQRVPPMTFVPLATVRARPVNERLRALGGTAKLALDLLDYDPGLERAFASICGSVRAACVLCAVCRVPCAPCVVSRMLCVSVCELLA